MKRYVVFQETTRCFTRNDTLFYKKRHVVLQETIRRFLGMKVKGELDADHRTVKVWIRWNHMIGSWGQIQITGSFLVGILSLVCSRRSPLDQKQPRNQLLNKKNEICSVSNNRFGLKGQRIGKMWYFFCNFAPLSEQGIVLRKTNDVERPLNLSHFSLYVTKMVLYFANLEDYCSCKHLRDVCGTDEL